MSSSKCALSCRDGDIYVHETFEGNFALWRTYMAESLGVSDDVMKNVLFDLRQGMELCPKDIASLNSMLAALQDMHPKDAMELRLIVQMLLTHNLACEYLGKSRDPGSLACDVYTRSAARFMRLYMQQLEMLRRYRNGGRQEITVNHIQASQAIVGDVYANRG